MYNIRSSDTFFGISLSPLKMLLEKSYLRFECIQGWQRASVGVVGCPTCHKNINELFITQKIFQVLDV